MADIRAFVGHSFNPDDEKVVRTFLDYFNQLARSPLNFSWFNAMGAEPKDLADKVLSLIGNANTFIGICTRKERIFVEGTANRGRWRRLTHPDPEPGPWKTSDWVIQEIGLAIGKGLDLIVLVEDGVRKPGGLQGNLEYVTFEREHPEKSFGKLMEMITALSPKGASVTSGAAEAQEADSEANAAESSLDELVPQIGWKREEYRRALFASVILKKIDEEKKIYESYLDTDGANHGDSKLTWQAYYEILLIRFSSRGDLAKLRSLATSYPQNSKIAISLAEAFDFYKEYAEAARCYTSAANLAQEPAEVREALARATLAHTNAGDHDNAAVLVERLKSLVDSRDRGEFQVLLTLRDVAENKKDDKLFIAISERMSELEPENDDVAFSLAYKYSQMNLNKLSLFHYLRIPPRQRTGMAWNNLGVAFDGESLTARAVDAWEHAKGMGETLAMSNLSNMLMKAGFLKEAQQECNIALQEKDYHQNIGSSIARLREIPIEESKSIEEFEDETKPVSDFYRQVGKAIGKESLEGIAPMWDGPDSRLLVRVDGRKFRAFGLYERPANRLLGIVAGGIGQIQPPTKYMVDFQGTIHGRAIYGSVSRTAQGETPSLLNGLMADREFVMTLTDDGRELRVMEPDTKKGTFYSLKLVDPAH